MANFSPTFVENVLKHFTGNSETIAIQEPGKNFRPVGFDGQLTPEQFASHLDGSLCYGFYLLDDNDCVRASCVDFDSHPDNPDPQWRFKTEQLKACLDENEIASYVEISSSGEGSHVWILFAEPVEAYLPRAFFRALSDLLDIPFPEIYPRQDRRKGGLGNLIRYPGFKNSVFVDVENDWEPCEPKFRTVELGDIKTVAARIGRRLEPQSIVVRDDGLSNNFVKQIENRPNGLIARRWNADFDGLKDQSNSACVQSLANAMVEGFFHPDEIDNVIVAYGIRHGYEKCNRQDFRERTILKAYSYLQEPRRTPSSPHHSLVECLISALKEDRSNPILKFGVPKLDWSWEGIGKGEMGIVMARPGHGKSAISLQWADQAILDGHAVLMLNAEMNWRNMADRYSLRTFGIGRDGWTGNEKELIAEAEALRIDGVDRSPKFRSISTIDDIEREVAAHKEGWDIAGVVIDYVQLVQNHKQSRYEKITDNSQRIKRLALDYDVAILVLAQAGREMERRGNIEFLLSDLKESGSLEQDADLVAGLYWHGRGNNDSMPPNRADMFLLKRRQGPIHEAMVPMLFDANTQKYSDWF